MDLKPVDGTIQKYNFPSSIDDRIDSVLNVINAGAKPLAMKVLNDQWETFSALHQKAKAKINE